MMPFHLICKPFEEHQLFADVVAVVVVVVVNVVVVVYCFIASRVSP